jgi:predicted metalloprotease with PDZ domain
MKIKPLIFLLACSSISTGWAQPSLGQTIEVELDAREANRRTFKVQLSVPVKAGPQSLVFPKWIPGEHGPTGPINSVVDFQLSANNQSLDWQRDPLDMHRVSFQVPAGIDRVQVRLTNVDGFASERLGVISWNDVIWFPAGASADDVRVKSKVLLPPGWTGVSALARTPGLTQIDQPEVSLTQLIDSPMLIGQHVNHVNLQSPSAPHAIHIAGESAAAIKLPENFAKTYSRLVEETHQVFRSHHYQHYDWLLSLSEIPRNFGGLEHHQCSDNIMPEETLSQESLKRELTGLLAHEFVHSWCGKFRRPQGLLSADYQKPMDGSLLWVYEGLTTFWGVILPVRCQSQTPEQFRESLAMMAAFYDHQSGKNWRPLADTATAAQLLYVAPAAWSNSRRRVDFYLESIFLWLEVETKLRELSDDKHGIDDFSAQFFGGPSGQVAVKPYVEKELYDTLERLVAYDWQKQIRSRLDSRGQKHFVQALKSAGWELVYSDVKNSELEESERRRKSSNRMFSLGMNFNSSNDVIDIQNDGPAGKAGLCPGMKLMAVNQREFSSKALDEAIAEAKIDKQPIQLLIKKDGYFRTLAVVWTGGARIPHLKRIEDQPDRLSALLKPRGKS